MSKRSDLINLGDPLPLSYKPVRQRPIPNQNQNQNQNQNHQQQQQEHRQVSNPIPIHNTNMNTSVSYNTSLRSFTSGNRPYIRSNLTTKERVRNKLRQLIHEVNEIEQINEIQLLELEERLNGLFELLHQDNGKQLEILEQEVNDEDEMITEFENARSSLQKLKQLNKMNYNFINNWKYWFIIGLVISVVFFLLSSLIMADFKYQYCYYFC
ncbi:hypothetical protein K6H09_000494 [Candida tropicalis]